MADKLPSFDEWEAEQAAAPAAPVAPSAPMKLPSFDEWETQQTNIKPLTKQATESIVLEEAKKAGLYGKELAAFMAQTAHESHDFKAMKEYGGGKPSYSGGTRYMGRGPLQVTHNYNYKKYGEKLKLDLLNQPELVEDPRIGTQVALEYWKENVRPKVTNWDDVFQHSKAVNAPFAKSESQVRGMADRRAKYEAYAAQLAPQVMTAKAPPAAAPVPTAEPAEAGGLLEPFALRKDYDKLKAELTKLVPLEERKKLDQPIIYGGHIENVREKRIMPSEFEALARKHGVKAEDLKPWAAWFGTPAAEMTVTDTLLKQGWRFALGELGEVVAGGVPQKLMIETEKDPKMVAALDDLRTIAENKKGWVQRGAEIAGGFMTGTGVAKGVGKLAATMGASKAVQATAATAAGITEAGVFGAAQAERGKEVAGFVTGVMFGTALTGAIEAGKQVIKGAKKLNEMRTKASKALQDADPQFMERAATKAAEESGGVGSIFNTAVVSNSSLSYEDMKDARVLAEKLGQDNVDAIYEYAVKTRPAKAEVIAENVRVQSDALKQKIADVEFRLQSDKIQPQTRAKLEDTLKSLQITLQKTEVDPKLAVVRSTVENLTRGLASDILGTRIAYRQTDPLAALRVYAKKGEGLTSDLDRYFLKQTARKMVRSENYKAMPDVAPTLKRLSDIFSASRFVAEGIDRKYGTKLQPALDNFGRLYSDLHSYVLPRAKETSDLIKQTRSANFAEGDDLFKALTTGQSTGDAAKDAVAQSWRKLFDDVLDDASTLGLNIAYRKNYVPMKTKPQEELFASLNQAVDTLKERGIVDLRNVKPDKDVLAKLRADDLGKQLLDSLDKLSPGKGDYQTKLISVLNDTKTGAINRIIAARGLQRGAEDLPDLIRDKDVGRLAQHWIESTFRSAVMREPIAELRDMADLMKRVGDKNANKYLQNLVADLTGVPRDGGLGRELSQLKSSMAATLQDRALRATNPTQKAIYSSLSSFTDAIPLMQNVMYGNALGGPRQVISNFSSIFTMTIPELGYLQGGRMVPKALLKAANSIIMKEEIVIRNPQVAKRLGVNIGDTVKTRSFRDILENDGLASGQRFENLEKSISNTLRKTVGREMSEAGINNLTKLQLFLFEGAEKSLRMMTRQLGKDLAEEYAKKTPGAMQFADSLPRSYRKMLDAAPTPEQQQRVLTDYLIAKTLFNYNQASASEVARNLGPILSSFTKWPTEILGDTLNTFQKNGVTAGSIDLVYRRFLPLIALMGIDQMTGWRSEPDDSPVRYFVGKQGATAWAPTNSLASIFSGEVAPPIVKVPAGVAAAATKGDPEAAWKSTKDALSLFFPGARIIEFIYDRSFDNETK